VRAARGHPADGRRASDTDNRRNSGVLRSFGITLARREHPRHREPSHLRTALAPDSCWRHHEDWLTSAIPAIHLAGRGWHPRCAADGLHGQWRRIPASRPNRQRHLPHHGVHRQGVVRLQLQLRGQGRPEPDDGAAPPPAHLHRPGHQPTPRRAVLHPRKRRRARPGAGVHALYRAEPAGARPERADLPGHLPANDTAAAGLPLDVPEA
jgi:hypothetical protein